MTTKGNSIKHFLKAILFIVCIGFVFSTKLTCEAGTTAAKEAFKAELRQMIFDVDISNHDISKYNLTITELQEVYRSLKQDPETKWMIASYYSNFGLGYTYVGNTVRKVYLMNVDGDVMKRYKVLLSNVSRIKSGIEPAMTDIDKIIYLHDCLTELASYSFLGYQSYGACGILGEGLGVCAGYTKAMNLLLEDQGIQSIYISSPEMDHGWNGVVLDGRWYHVDVTWDDPTGAKPGETRHTYLLMSDDAISKGSRPHSGWEASIADSNAKYDSTKYDNWYVHDIIGKMSFENGKWYYVDYATNCILENTVAGGSARVILNAKGETKLEMVDATASGITYKQGGVVKQTGYEGVSGESFDVPTNVVSVDFYLLQEGTDSYTKVGSGYLENPETSSDAEYVNKCIVSGPDVSNLLKSDQIVEWNRITKSGAGKYFVKGEVKTVEPEVADEKERPAGTQATFYLAKAGFSGLIDIGRGLVTEGDSSSNNSIISSRIVDMPDVSEYVGENEYIVWLKMTYYPDKEPTVRGEVKSIEPVVVTEVEKVAGTQATFYLSKTGYSGLINVGSGLITEGGSSSNNSVISSRIVDMPDVSEYVSEDEYIVWLKLTSNSDKAPTVRGEVRKK